MGSQMDRKGHICSPTTRWPQDTWTLGISWPGGEELRVSQRAPLSFLINDNAHWKLSSHTLRSSTQASKALPVPNFTVDRVDKLFLA